MLSESFDSFSLRELPNVELDDPTRGPRNHSPWQFDAALHQIAGETVRHLDADTTTPPVSLRIRGDLPLPDLVAGGVISDQSSRPVHGVTERNDPVPSNRLLPVTLRTGDDLDD